jgi:hypothetical protein
VKALLFSLLLTATISNVFAQSTVTSEILTPAQVQTVFTPAIKKELELVFPIYRVYHYTDKGGEHYFVCTESRNKINGTDTISYQIKGVNVAVSNGKLTKAWELKDFVVTGDQEEVSIWFWTKYCGFEDYDKDGLIEPIIIYGTNTTDGDSDGRIKILTYYKGQKYAIRHQNSTFDEGRETQIDKAFYELPVAVQTAVKQKMESIVENRRAIFPYGWQNAMQHKKTIINQRNR